MVIALMIICRISSIVGVTEMLLSDAYISAKHAMNDCNKECSTPYLSKQGLFCFIMAVFDFDTHLLFSIWKKSCTGNGRNPHRLCWMGYLFDSTI